MKIKSIVLVFMGAVLFSNVPLFAHGGDEHGKTKSVEELTSPAAVWQNIRAEEKELGEIIESGKLDRVHEIAFTIRDLAKMFLDNSKGKPGVPIGLLMTQIGQIGSIAELLDEYGDANNKPKTKEQFQRLKTLLDVIESQYPKALLNVET